MRMLVLCTFVAGLMAACGGGGEPDTADVGIEDTAAYQRRAAAELRQGMSKEQVRSRLGEPRTRVTMDGGLERWTYYNYDDQGQITARTLIIFGNDGKIVEVNNM